jgi:hypothetical protein
MARKEMVGEKMLKPKRDIHTYTVHGQAQKKKKSTKCIYKSVHGADDLSVKCF